MEFSIWHWFVVIAITFLITYPIFYPMYLWYVKKDRNEKSYVLAKRFRKVLAFLIALTLIPLFTSQKFTSEYEFIGAILGKVLMIYLLLRNWKKIEVEENEKMSDET